MTEPTPPNPSQPSQPARKKAVLEFRAACPSCGAQVVFKSSASVMAVCEYCQTTVLRDDNTIREQGKMSAVLEDFSPLQLHSQGMLDGVAFTLVGRIQLKYPDGLWNEWYLQFDDGTNGWLSDASGLYVVTRQTGVLEDAPTFDALTINQLVAYKSVTYRVTDHRTATCTGGEGELPMVVGQGWQASVADLRFQARFMTLDYSDGYPPQVYEGRAATLTGLKMQLLRDADQIQAATGQVKGKLTKIECPNCGSPVPYVMGMAEHLVCPACRAEVAMTDGKAELLVKHKELVTLKSALSLGDQATFDDHAYVVIGIVQMEEVGDDEASLWTEYLLYSLEAGFLWLVDEGKADWQKVVVLNEVPEEKAGNAFWQGQRWDRQWTYQGRVLYAVGAFNWRIKIGDTVGIADFARGNERLTSEQNANEINWSHAVPISGFTVRELFGKRQPPREATLPTTNTFTTILKWLSVVLWLINLPIILFGGGMFFLVLIAQFVLIFLPTLMQLARDDGDQSPAVNSSVSVWGVVIILIVTFLNLTSHRGSSTSSWSSSSGGYGYSGGYGGSSGGHK